MKKYRLFGKIPVFDAIVIAILLIAGIVGFYALKSSKSGKLLIETKTETIRYTVVFKGISNMIGLPSEGEKVKDFSNNFDMGEVVSVREEPRIVYDYDMVTGDSVATTYTDRRDIIVEIETTAQISERCTQVNNVKIGLGKVLTFSMPSLCSDGVISDLTEVK